MLLDCSLYKIKISFQLTKTYAQCVQTSATRRVKIIPKLIPEFLKATGIANIPVPREAFNK